MKKLIWLIIAAFLAASAISVATDYKGAGGQSVSVFIPLGTGSDEIIGQLHDMRVIRHPLIFKLYLGDDTAGFKAGIHEMREFMGYENAKVELERVVPMDRTVRVTIPEGFELSEIAARVEESGIVSREDFLRAAAEKYDHDFLSGIKTGDKYLEGYLYPATYDLAPSMSARQVITLMLDRFGVMLGGEYKSRIREMGMTVHEAVTLASIIEREAAAPDERAVISSVFHNRLKSADFRYLQSCATVQYVLEERREVLSEEDTKINSPYNTYLYPGLPPGPIASPGEESFKAALYPADTEYLFFVASGNGNRHIFSKTYEEHLKAQGR